MRIQIDGTLTEGYYNDMEAGFPVFIDGQSLSNAIKGALTDLGMDSKFSYGCGTNEGSVKNPLIGKSVRLTLEILEEKEGQDANDTGSG